mgnify:CR=1 FL=1
MACRSDFLVYAFAVVMVFGATAPGGVLSAELQMEKVGESSSEGVYFNQYSLTLANTGDVPIFAVFIKPDGYYLGGTMGLDTDNWDSWSVAAYENGWYRYNAYPYNIITELNDVPNPLGWGYTDHMGIFWNFTHDPNTHATDDPLVGGDTLADFCIFSIGQSGEPINGVPTCTVMIAGYDGAEIVTNWFIIPEPTSLGLLLMGGLTLLRRRRLAA